MKKLFFITMMLCCLFMISCTKDDEMYSANKSGITIQLISDSYSNESRSKSGDMSLYDRMIYYIADRNGNIIRNMKSKYDYNTSKLYIEGLKEGEYKLLVLGIKGDESKDRVTINELNKADDVWLTFPEDLDKPLDAEYFHSVTPFNVSVQTTENGNMEVASLQGSVKQKRIMGRMDVLFNYNNKYIRTSVYSKKMNINGLHFYTSLSGNGAYSGESNGQAMELDLIAKPYYNFMPMITPLSGEITMLSRTYNGNDIEQIYGFEKQEIKASHINNITVHVSHPDDKSGLMYITRMAYNEGSHGKILQDDESKDIYQHESLRKFNTMKPLQVSATDDGKLHVRFYSPKGLSDVLVKVRIPSVSNEPLKLAYFDTIPPFADFYENISVFEKDVILRSESGKNVEVSRLNVSDLRDATFNVESNCDYWKKLQEIKFGWDISFDLYGGDPDQPDGKPNGNWMGIRPVHCRESVAFFLNYTYVLGLPELDVLIKSNPDDLYDDKHNLVDPDYVLEQMRTYRNLRSGLIYEGNGVSGLGGGRTWGVAEWIYFRHYFDTYACELAFHEIGHVMGYGHSSAFTYGPWARKLINHFYVDNMYRCPVESKDYLDSNNNPNKYYH